MACSLMHSELNWKVVHARKDIRNGPVDLVFQTYPLIGWYIDEQECKLTAVTPNGVLSHMTAVIDSEGRIYSPGSQKEYQSIEDWKEAVKAAYGK